MNTRIKVKYEKIYDSVLSEATRRQVKNINRICYNLNSVKIITGYYKGLRSMMEKYKSVLLTDFVEALEKVDDLCSVYIHKLTGELIELTVEACEKYERIDITGWDNYVSWEMDTIKEAERVLNDPEFIKIPDKFEIHEYRIMEDFIETIQNDTLKDEFYHAIQGKGAFQRFKNKLNESGIETDWFDYKKGQLAHFSRDWLRKNKIHFIDDFRI